MAGGPALDRALADVSEELADSSFEYAMRDLYRGSGLRPYRSPLCPPYDARRVSLVCRCRRRRGRMHTTGLWAGGRRAKG